MICAAVWYWKFQDEPPVPILLKLNVPEKPTQSQIELALKQYFIEAYEDNDKDDDEDYKFSNIDQVKVLKSLWGDYMVVPVDANSADDYCSISTLIVSTKVKNF